MSDVTDTVAPLLRKAGRNRWGFDRTGSTATLAVIAIIGLILVIPAGLAALVGDPTESIPEGATIDLGGVASLTVSEPGWTTIESESSSSSIVLRNGLLHASFATTSGVQDAGVYFQRQVRNLKIAGVDGRLGDVASTKADLTVVSGTITGSARDIEQAVVVDRSGNGVSVTVVAPRSAIRADQQTIDALVAGVKMR